MGRHNKRDKQGHFDAAARKKHRKKEMIASVANAEDPDSATPGEPQPARPRRGRPPGSKSRPKDGMSPSDLTDLLASAHKGLLEVTAAVMKRDTSGGELDGPSKALGELSSKALAAKLDGEELDTKTALWIYGAVGALTLVSIFALPRKDLKHEPGKKDESASARPGGAVGAVEQPLSPG